MAIDFNRLKKHTQYTLEYEINGESLFEIVPDMNSKTKFLEIIKKSKDTDGDLENIKNFIYELFLKDNKDATDEQKEIVRVFINDNILELTNQTMVGFRMTTKDKIDEKMKIMEDKLLDKQVEKNLMWGNLPLKNVLQEYKLIVESNSLRGVTSMQNYQDK